MSEPFLKNLECACIQGTSATCPGGGAIIATMTLQEGALFATIANDAKITSPGEQQLCYTTRANDVQVTGSGPYYTVKFVDFDGGLPCTDLEVSPGWTLRSFNNTYDSTYQVINVYNDGSLLVYGVGTALNAKPNTDTFWTTQLYGVGHTRKPNIGITKSVNGSYIFGSANIDTIFSAEYPLSSEFNGIAQILEQLKASYTVSEVLDGDGSLINTTTDKVAGQFGDFYCQGKLYPSGDIAIDSGFGAFCGPSLESTNLWSNIDEGIYEGVLKDKGDSNLLSDDNNSFIEPNTIHTNGLFQYKCELTEMYVRPDYSSFRIRVAAPISNYESKIPPLYTLYNIRLSDPSGNLIVKYNDIQIRGDSTDEAPNFATYSSLPQFNVLTDKFDWERTDSPHMYNVSGYQLSFSVRAVSLDDPFHPGFDSGFEENYIIQETFNVSGNNYLSLDGQPLSSQEVNFINPTRGFRVSAVEICNSGGYGPRLENFIPFNMPVREIGRRLERIITPTFMPLNTYDTSIYPAISSNVWEDGTSIIAGYTLGATNESTCGAKELVNILNTKNYDRFIKLKTITGGGVANSGKLILKFQTGYNAVDEITNGDFNFAFDQGTSNSWWQPSGAFNVENRTSEIQQDISFYNVESITLKVLAKKEVGSRDYILDVVGYSDDKLLGVTPASGGFIQDPSGVYLNDTFVSNTGNYPVLSGFYRDNSDWTVGGGSLSERDDYFQASGNDHYKLAQYPVVTSTDFQLYEVPLVILDDNVRLGQSRDYSVSSFLEHVYLDIYPLPSGAAIAYAELCVRYAPANAVNLYTQGGATLGKTQDGRSEAAIFPSGMQSYDSILNAGSGYAPISRIENIPHAYGSPNTIKTNYARRWRGMEGLAKGDFHPTNFDFSFYNPLLDYPFNCGFFDFDYDEGKTINSKNTSDSGTFHTTYTNGKYRYKNIGWRFINHTLFNDQLPGYTGLYQTTDWTSLSTGTINFVNNPLYGQIADAFNNIVRISGQNSYIDFGHTLDIANGFTAYVKFTPDVNVSGVNYNLFNSGVLISKWGRHNTAGGRPLEFALGYEGGYLCGYARTSAGSVVKVKDTTLYSDYQYPLAVILTYNDKGLSGLKLYTDNEFAYPWTTLRASSSPFNISATGDSDVVLGFSTGSGVGMNMFVSEFGLASGCKIVESNPDLQLQETTADIFLANQRVKWFDPSESYANDTYSLWKNVDEDTYNDWHIGDFKYCHFDASFDFLTKRTGRDLISFSLKSDGLGYSQKTNITLPSSIDNNVAYHTQIENDFLRFHLSDVPNNFYSVNRRITKNIPTGYKFSERALVVETVLEHKFGDGIKWSGCESIVPSGPKMIVSLYTKKQEPYWTTTEPNWGLVNRKIHYIEPSSCFIKLESTFDYEDLVDQTEPWALFPTEPRLKDFTERYFKDDVNQMFVQYDLVYPSGAAFESRIDLHSSHVRMADANILGINTSGTMSLNASGGFPSSSQINLNIGGFPRDASGMLPLSIQVPIPYDVFSQGSNPSGFLLSISGAFNQSASLNLFIPPQSGYSYFNLSISGELPTSSSSGLSLSMPNVLGILDTHVGNFFGMPLTLYNAELAGQPDGPVLNLNLFASSGSTAMLSALPFLLYNQQKNIDGSYASGLVSLNIVGNNQTVSTRPSQTMPLYINAPNTIDTSMPLYLYNPITEALLTGTVNLVTASYNSSFGASVALWDNNNYGTDIDIEDNHVAFLPVSNEIRGVDLTAYGSCDGESDSKAIDQAVVTDCTVWRDEVCNNAGLFRAKDTYTNSGAINFNGGYGYSGNYYGIRKFEDLLPSVSYQATLVIKTGTTDPIPVPRTFEEWEYGMCGPAWYANNSGCCTGDCDQNIVFSGVKLVADDACGVPPSSNLCVDPALIVASGRNKNDTYGRSVRVHGDLMAVSSPNITIPDYSPYDSATVNVSGAGAVFLYRRGDDEAGKKAGWSYIEQLMLPSGFRKDYIQRSTDNLLTFDQFSISGNKWQIGQEGRSFGESLDICSSGSREVVVVGAPRAKWSRSFSDIKVSGIPTAGMIFVDLFEYDKSKLQSVASTAEKYNILWKYFSAPWGTGVNAWYSKISPKLIVMQFSYSNRSYPVVPTDESSWFVHKYLPRLDDLDLLFDVGSGVLGGSGSYADFIASGKPIVFNQMFSGVKDAFFTAFPSGSTQFPLYSGIPAIVGMFKEQTGSIAGALQYADKNGTVYNIYNEFEKFYLAHSYASGVRDNVQNIKQSGYLNIITGKSESWDTTSKLLLADTFDSGKLATTFTNTTLNRNFITSGVGQEWGATHGSIVSQFQVPPASGGRVYIFENERGNFNCIQTIVSPNDQSEFLPDIEMSFGSTYSKTYNDRFGHSVSISKNGEVIAVGSPWNIKSCKIFERNEEETQKVYDRIREWCVATNRQSAVNHYDAIVSQSGIASAKTSTYDYIQSSDRFEYRHDINFWGTLPAPYTLSYEYGYDDIEYVGTRQFLVNEFAPTSRLGWSTAVDENGEMVAFGAPTDSLNQFDDANVWGDSTLSWASYVNAGAVRIFNNKKYYPHDKVVEFGRFGNLDRSSHPTEKALGYYDDSNWPLVFASGADGTTQYIGKSWRRMNFSEIEIPQDAGLAFIITPELDAASDEIIQNIKDWLALGDRNLVLVGNDPVWEENGLYEESNEIINKILEKLGSRMRLHPAKNISYSMQGCVSQNDLNNNKYNATQSYLPNGSTGRSIEYDGQYYVKGVGDIRIDLSRDSQASFFESLSCPEGATCSDDPAPIINVKCEFPLKGTYGDLRAEWKEQCVKTTPNSCKIVTYNKNWPFHFENFTVDCDEPPVSLFKKANQEPVPVLTTAEHLPPSAWYDPENSGLLCDYYQPMVYQVYQQFEEKSSFAANNINQVAFNIQENGESTVSGNFNKFYYNGSMFDPSRTNGRDCLIQATGNVTAEPIDITEVAYPDNILALVESGRNINGAFNNSRIYLLATQWSEDDASRGLISETLNDDKNTEFYINMVRNNCANAPRGIQVNGFTGRTSLNNAYYFNGNTTTGHSLANKLNVEFIPNGGFFKENQQIDSINDQIDFVWLAFPSGKPSVNDLTALNTWLDLGNRKLIITYSAMQEDNAQQIADNISYLCSGLRMTSKPMFLPKTGKYYTSDIISRYELEDNMQVVNYATDSISGCNDGYTFTYPNYQYATSLSGVEFNPSTSNYNEFDRTKFVPLSGGQNFERIISFAQEIKQTYKLYGAKNTWKIDGSAAVTFPIQPGSGYRVWINWVSETPSEKFDICVNASGINIGESSVGGGSSCGQIGQLEKTTTYVPHQLTFDFKTDINDNIEEFGLTFDTSKWSTFISANELQDIVLPPATPRILSISGALLPVTTEVMSATTSGLVPYGQPIQTNCRYEVNPAASGIIPGVTRPVKHKSSNYCSDNNFTTSGCVEVLADWENQLIEDGPVIVAEEFENFSSFQNGARRSKIILISDSTLVQGQCPHYRASTIDGNQSFIRNLYPASPNEINSVVENLNYNEIKSGRNWNFAQKLRAPERGSPAKYVAVSGVGAGQLVSSATLSTYSLITTGGFVAGFIGGVLASNGDIHFVPHSQSRGQKISSAGIVSTYSLVYYLTQAYAGGAKLANGDIHFTPYAARVGQKISSAGVVSTYSLLVTGTNAYNGAVLDTNGDIHFIPHTTSRGQKIAANGTVSTYSLVYTVGLGSAYIGGVLASNGDVHFAPRNANRGQKVSSAGIVSTYSLVYTTSDAYAGAVLAINGDIHFAPNTAKVGQKVSSAGVVSTYSLVYTTTDAYYGAVLASNGDIHFIPNSAKVGQKVSSIGVVSTYSLPYTTTTAYAGGVLAQNGDIHFVPASANRGTKISSGWEAINYTLMPTKLWGANGASGNLGYYSDNEDTYNPTTMSRPAEIKDPDRIKQLKKQFFDNEVSKYGMYPRFSGDFLSIATYKGGIYTDYDILLDLDDVKTQRNFIVDGNIGGGLTELMKIEGTDYLDYSLFNSGCPGDLFGYSIALDDNKLIVGAPYNAFYTEGAISGVSGIVQWHEIQNDATRSGIRIGADGGAGAAFIFEKTDNGKNVVEEFLPLEFVQKIKPSSLNVGIYDFNPNPVQRLTNDRGPHQIADTAFILEYARRGDRFGFSVDVACDMAVIGAPNHCFETLHHHVYSGSVVASGLNSAFQKKSFDAEFDIPKHSRYDLADSGIRVNMFNHLSGTMILNGGAVYNYRNEMVDFQGRQQKWIFGEKLFAAGYKSRTQTVIPGVLTASGSDNDNFGLSVAIDRAARGDSDYTLVVGSPYHDWPTSGNHPTKGLDNAGAAYTFDCMLREQIPSTPNSSGWLDAHVFGNKTAPGSADRLELRVYQNTSGDSLEYKVSGILFSDSNGSIFLEVSGFDPSTKGFISHRPYVDRVELQLFPGTETNTSFNLMTSGGPVINSGNMNLVLLGANQANVYNNLGLYHFGVSGLASGAMPSGLSLFISAPSGPISDSLNLSLASTQTTNALNLRTRGY